MYGNAECNPGPCVADMPKKIMESQDAIEKEIHLNFGLGKRQPIPLLVT